VEGDAGDVVGVAFEGDDWVGISGLDVVEFDVVAARGGEVFLVGRDAEAVYLRFGVLDCAAADTAEGFPEADCVVIAGFYVKSTVCACFCEDSRHTCAENNTHLVALTGVASNIAFRGLVYFSTSDSDLPQEGHLNAVSTTEKP